MNFFRLFLLVGFLLLANFLFSQDKKQDSIVISLKKYNERDSIRILKLFDVVNYYNSNNFSKTKEYIEEAISISKEIKSKIYEGKSLRLYARYYLKKGFADKALEQAILSNKIANSLQLQEEQLLSNSLLLSIYGRAGYFSKALDIGLKNLQIVNSNTLINEKYRYYIDLARVYRAKEDYKKAEEYYLKSLFLVKEDKAKKALLQMSLGELYKRDFKFDLAKKHVKIALDYYKNNKEKESESKALYILATIFSLENKHVKATKYYNQALEHFKKTENLYYQKIVSQNLYINYCILQENEKAKEVNTLYNAVKDTIESNERKKMVAQMKTKYETDKIIAQKKIVELKNKQNRAYFLSSLLLGFLLLALSLFYINRIKVKKKSELLNLELIQTKKRLGLEKQYRNSELKALKSQMNPHFLFNAMNSVQSLILKGDKKDAYNYLTKFATLIRENLNMSEKSFVYFDDELNLINTYLELEKLRFTKNFVYIIEGEKTIDDIKIPSMIIQPFIENAIKHGLLHKSGLKKINIYFKQDDLLTCTIIDNGIGRKASEVINNNNIGKYKSFSTSSIEKRFELLKEYYDLDLGFEYVDLYNDKNYAIGTKVVLKIPFIQDDE